MRLPLSILWVNTLSEWVNTVLNNFPGIVSEEREWYLLQRLNSVPQHLLEIQKTPPDRNPALISAHEPILVITIPGIADTLRTVINPMTH
jgi:hypothetical protein